MRMRKLLLVLYCMLLIVLIGCSYQKFTSEDTNEDIGIIGSLKGIDSYLNNFIGMEYEGYAQIDIDTSIRTKQLYNTYLGITKDKKSFLEWSKGGISLLISRDIQLNGIFNDGEQDIPDSEWVINGVYNIYKYTSAKSYSFSDQYQEYYILVEDGTENSDNPHIYIWKIEITRGIMRSGIMLPSIEKINIESVEINRKEN